MKNLFLLIMILSVANLSGLKCSALIDSNFPIRNEKPYNSITTGFEEDIIKTFISRYNIKEGDVINIYNLKGFKIIQGSESQGSFFSPCFSLTILHFMFYIYFLT